MRLPLLRPQRTTTFVRSSLAPHQALPSRNYASGLAHKTVLSARPFGNDTESTRSDVSSSGRAQGARLSLGNSKPLWEMSAHEFSAPFFARTFSSKASQVRELEQSIDPKREISLSQIMTDLSDLQRLEVWQGTSLKSGNSYKDAIRCLYPLWHTVDSAKPDAKITIRFEDLLKCLPSVYSLAWRAISERVQTGKVAKLANLTARNKAAVSFLQLYAVGPKFAEKFVTAGARTFDDLANKCELTRTQKIGLRHKDDINRLIPREEMDKLKEALEDACFQANDRFGCAILGSYRRGVDFSSDIDLVLRNTHFWDETDEEASSQLLHSVTDVLLARGFMLKEDLLSNGSKKVAGLIKLPDHKHWRRIDIRMAPMGSFPYMLLGSTGDALLMKLLRHTAKAKGMCLNEYGMGDKFAPEDQNPNGFREGTSREVESEKEIFELLGMPYLEPEQRDYSTWRKIYLDAGVDLAYVEKA